MTQCPNCHSCEVKKNGKTHYGKQNYKCKKCSKQFVLENTHTIPESKKTVIRRLLNERLSLRAICRTTEVSLTWLMSFVVKEWARAPADLGISEELTQLKSKRLKITGLQHDEMWSFVGNKNRKAWIWVAYEPQFKQVVAFHIGNRGVESAQKLWTKIPKRIHNNCYFETDEWEASNSILPFDRHYTGKDETYLIEGFFASIRAKVSRLVRKSLSFSKKWENHVAAIQYFLWNFNLNHQPYI